MHSIKEIHGLFDASNNVVLESKKLSKEIILVIEKIVHCIENGNKVITFGNGGSAADAQHMAAEFIGRYLVDRQSIAAISFTTDSSIITAIGNDYGFDNVFSRQCESLVRNGDIVIAISTSGSSKNVIKGIKVAKKKGAIIVGLTGGNGNMLKDLCDICIVAPSSDTPRIQECHRIVIHIICELVEKHFK